MPKRKKRDTRTWYQKVSRGGTRYINLNNPYNLSRLTMDELFYLDYQKRVYKYDLNANISEYSKYRKSRNREFMRSARMSQYDLLSGKLFRKSLDTYKENYKTALSFNGYSFLGDLFDKVWDRLSYYEKDSFAINDIPEIPIFYKIKLKAESKSKENQIGERQIHSSMKELARKLLKTAVDYNLDLKDIDLKILDLAGIKEKVLNDVIQNNKSMKKAIKDNLPTDTDLTQ